jgi:hypothetical protein
MVYGKDKYGMVPEFYRLAESSFVQDAQVLAAFGAALAVLLGWRLVRASKRAVLEQIYIGLVLLVYLALLLNFALRTGLQG